jgi:hypothetical protein
VSLLHPQNEWGSRDPYDGIIVWVASHGEE